MKRLSILLILVAVCISLVVYTEAYEQTITVDYATITVENVPDTGLVGETVTIPAASKAEDYQGNDVTSTVKVSVYHMKNDGETINAVLLDNADGTVPQTFVIRSNRLLKYLVVYRTYVGTKITGEEVFEFLAVADQEGGELTVHFDSIENYTAEQGVYGSAGQPMMLPAVTATDMPSGKNVAHLVNAKLYLVENGTLGTLMAQFYDFTQAKEVYLPQGQYLMVLSCTDPMGNAFEQECVVPVNVDVPIKTNLVHDVKNFVLRNKIGESWFNDYGEIAVGQTSQTTDKYPVSTCGFSMNVTKIYEQYVGITFSADDPGNGGQMFYSINARGSYERGTTPDVRTHNWPDYLFLRISKGKVESRVDRASDSSMNTIKAFTGNLVDGNDHTLYLQWRNMGASADAEDAAIRIYGWVDTVPTANDEDASFIFEAVPGDATGKGVLERSIFTELYNETGAGWFSVSTYTQESRPFSDDHIRIKGLVVYEKTETEFATDIMPPQITADFDNSHVFAIDEPMTIPTATTTEGTVKYYIVTPAGEKIEVQPGQYTPTQTGVYTLQMEAYDAAGNLGHLTFEFRAAPRDTEAPTLTLDSLDPIYATVGDSVRLPNALAQDAQDGELTQDITIEIIGTEHVTNLTNGGIYCPNTAGTQVAYFTVSDMFGNTTVATVEIHVASKNKTGNLLTDPITVSSGNANGLPSEEYIYDQKVSMILNIEKLDSVLMFNVRGPVVNNNWPKGMVLRWTKNGEIEISANGHDSHIFGKTEYELFELAKGLDILFEYQVDNVTIDGVEYIRTRVWIQGEELTFAACNDGLIGLEADVKGVYRKVSDFLNNEAQEENIYSSYFWAAASSSTVTIKELRTDGTSCEMPEGPVVPVGLPMPEFQEGHDFITETLVTTKGADGNYVLGKNSNEEYVSITFSGTEAAKGSFCVNITGEGKDWTGGLVLRLTQDHFALKADGVNATTLANFDVTPYYVDGVKQINANTYTMVYKLTYLQEQGVCTGIQIDIWLGLEGQTLTKVKPTYTNTDYFSYNEETDQMIINPMFFKDTPEKIVPGNITLIVRNALNGTDCQWTVKEIKTLDSAPAQVEGLPMPEFQEGHDFITETLVTTKGADGNYVLGKNSNEEYVSITFSGTEAAKGSFCVNITGEGKDWTGGLVLRLTQDHFALKADGVNATTLANFDVTPYYVDGVKQINANTYTMVYKLTYLQEQGVCTGIQIDIWLGLEGQTLTKVKPTYTNTDYFSYNEETDQMIINPMFFKDTPEKIVPGNITLIVRNALNGTDCQWTVKEIKTLDSAPAQVEGLPMPEFQEGHDFITETLVTTKGADGNYVLGKNSNEEYVSITFSGTEAAKGSFCVNITGEGKDWTGGLVLRLTQDHFALKADGVNATTLANFDVTPYYVDGVKQINANTYTMVYKLTYLQEQGVCTGIQIDIWLGLEGQTLTKVKPTYTNTDYFSYNEETDQMIINPMFFKDTPEKIVPGNITLIVRNALNGTDCQWTVKEIKTLDSAPGTAAQSSESALSSEVMASQVVAMPADADAVRKSKSGLTRLMAC